MEEKNYEMSFFDGGVSSTIPSKTINLDSYVSLIKEDKGLTKVLKRYIASDNVLRHKLKLKDSPIVTAQAIVSKRSKSGVLKRTGLFIIDIDNISDIEGVWDQLINDPYICVCHKTISQSGFRGILRIDINSGEHIDYYYAIEEYFKSTYQIIIDKSCKDIARGIILSHDKDVFYNPNSKLLNSSFIQVWRVTNKKTQMSNKSISKPNLSKEQIDYYSKRALLKAKSKIIKAPDGKKHKTLLNTSSWLGSYVFYGLLSEDEVINTLKLAINSRLDVKSYENAYKTIESGFKYGLANPIPKSNLFVENEGKFWLVDNTGKKPKITISHTQLYRFLERNGFGKIKVGNVTKLIKVVNNVISLVDKSDFIHFTLNYIKNLPIDIGDNQTKDALEEVFRRNMNVLFSDNQLHTNSLIKPEYNNDEKETAYLYFKNGILKITKNNTNLLMYESLEKSIWDSQILDFEYKEQHIKPKSLMDRCEFSKFLQNISDGDEERFTSFCSIIGYLLHNYKDPSFPKSVVFCDEKISEEPNGGTGKGIVLKAISKLKKTALIDGKNLSFGNRFLYQQVEIDTDIIVFEDVEKGFDFERLFSATTEGLNVEKKNKDKFHIPFSDSPKIAITTNYAVLGIGSSHERRKIEIELSQHYNSDHKPCDDFGHNLFDDWNHDNWTSFFNFMVWCIQLFLKKGVINPPQININKRKLILETSPEFVDFATLKIETNKEYEKSNLLYNFYAHYPEYDKFHWFSQRYFNRWLRAYANLSNFKAIERVSNNKQLILFKAQDAK